MKPKLSQTIKKKFKADVFTNLIKEDIKVHGKPRHSINNAYIGIEWALKQNEEIKKLIEDNDYDKGYQDAIEKAKKIIISFIPLPSYKNHNMNYDLELLKEREEYAKQVAENFEEMMNYEK